MKGFSICFLLSAFAAILFPQISSAQCSTAQCATPIPAVDPADACVLPNPAVFDCYVGETFPDAPIIFPPWCGDIHNNHWFAFTADANEAVFSISVFDCTSAIGLQAAIFSTVDCVNFTLTSNCLGNIPPNSSATLNATNLTPGQVYYMCIDGSAGDICSYSINPWQADISGTTNSICIPSSPLGNYNSASPSVWTIVPPSAGTIIGNNTGSNIQVQWQAPGPAQVCVSSISCDPPQEFCMDINIGADAVSEEHVEMCQGYSVSCAGVEFDAPGTYPVHFLTDLGCDSVVRCRVTVIPSYNGPIKFVTMCGPSSYEVCNNTYTTTGIYTDVCTGSLGCDSILHTDLAILEPVATIAPPAALDCGTNSVITLNGSASTINGATNGTTLYQWSGPGILGFDNQPTIQVNQPGTYCLVLTHGRAGTVCRDTACVTVIVSAAVPGQPQITGEILPCGDSTEIYTATAAGNPAPNAFFWSLSSGINYTLLPPNAVSIEWDTVAVVQLCVTAMNTCGTSPQACVNITVQPPVEVPVLTGPTVVCAGNGDYLYTLNNEQIGVIYDWSGPPGAVLTGAGDSVLVDFSQAISGQVCVTAHNNCGQVAPVCQTVTVNPVPTVTLSGATQMCAGDSVALVFGLSGNGPFNISWDIGGVPSLLTGIQNGHSLLVSPQQTTVYQLSQVSDGSSPACTAAVADSLILQVWQPTIVPISAQICQGETYNAGGASQGQSGIYTDSLHTVHGCDSVIVTTLTVLAVDTLLVLGSTCDPSQAGTVTMVFSQANGCDSIVILTTVLHPTDTTLQFDKSCLLSNTGVFTQSLTNQWGCDSIVVTTISFALSDTTYINATNCDPLQVGVFSQGFLTPDGCDSVVVTTVSLLPESQTMVSSTTCDPSAAGVFMTVFQNQWGCDSTVTQNVSFVPIPTTQLTAASCDPAQVGVFNQTLVTAAGCDSAIVTTVTLLPSSVTTLSSTTCNPTQAGVFSTVLPNVWGCDSTVTLTVSYVPLPVTQLVASTCDPAQAGVFSQSLVTAAGCDSMVVTTVSLLPESQTTVTATTCDQTQAGVFTQVFSNQWGCDSTVIKTVSLLPESQTAVTATTCDPTQVGVFTQVLTNQWGCDSTVIKSVLLLPESQTAVTVTTCDPLQAGVFTQVLPNQWGCDSTILTTVSLLPANSCSVSVIAEGASIPCGAASGNITVSATVGEAPFIYTVAQGGMVVATGTLLALNTPLQIGGFPAGVYTVTLSSPNGYSDTATATVAELIPPILESRVTTTYAGYGVSCEGASDGVVQAMATGGAPPYMYAWSGGGTTPIVPNLPAGTYTVTVTDTNGCTNSSTLILTSPDLLRMSLTVNHIDCFGQDFGAILVTPNGGVGSYLFAIDGGLLQPEALFGGLAAGAHSLEVVDANGCLAQGTIVVNAAFQVGVELGDDQQIDLGGSATLTAVVNVPLDSILSVVWSPPLLDPECPAPCLGQVVSPYVSTVYSVQVQALNGCTGEDQVRVLVDRRKQVFVPNVFSPNGDGENDVFTIYSRPGTVAKIKYLQVFDRWGENVFTLRDFQPNSSNLGWDGNYKGQKMDPAVFVWVAEIEFVDNQTEVFKGDVTIAR